jgi:hypothetical protein
METTKLASPLTKAERGVAGFTGALVLAIALLLVIHPPGRRVPFGAMPVRRCRLHRHCG